MVSERPKMGTAHLQSIDLLRALAILLVVLYHSQDFLFTKYMLQRDGLVGIPHDSSLKRILLTFSPSAYGWSGVDLFLLISGFLIHSNTIVKPGRPDWRSFFSKRFFRIYPPYLVALFFFGFFNGPYPLDQWVWHLSMLFNLNDGSFFTINPSFWSLALEMQLYAVYPILYWCRGRLGIDRTVMLIAGVSVLTTLWIHFAGPCGFSVRMSLPRLWILWALGAWVGERYVQDRTLFKHHGKLLVVLLILVPLVQFSVLREYLFRYQIMLIHAVLLEWVVVTKPTFFSMTTFCPMASSQCHVANAPMARRAEPTTACKL